MSTASTFKAEQAALRKEYLEIKARGESSPDYWLPYYDKAAGHFARLSNGDIVVIDKPRIETRFCFGESGYDYDEAQEAAAHAARSEAYFKQENLSELQRWIDRLEGRGRPSSHGLYTFRRNCGLSTLAWGCVYDYSSPESGWEPLNDTDRATLLAVYRAAYAAFEKRLDTYLKRYGLSKVRTWTYWRDA